MQIEVHIEEVMLQGFPPADRYRVAEALEEELAHLVRARGLPAWMTAGDGVIAVEGGTFTIEPGVRADQIGTQIARAIYGGRAL